MASASGRKTTKSRKTNTKAKGKKTTTSRGKKNQRKDVDIAVKNEVVLIAIFAIAIFTFLCVIGAIHGVAAE